MTSRTEQISIRRTAEGSLEMLPSRADSRPDTLLVEAQGIIPPTGYFATATEPPPMAYYRRELQNDPEDLYDEFEEPLADMSIVIVLDMRHDEFMLEDDNEFLYDDSEISYDDFNEGLRRQHLAEVDGTEPSTEEESKIHDNEPTEDNSTAPISNEESDTQNYEPAEEDRAEPRNEEESQILDNGSE